MTAPLPRPRRAPTPPWALLLACLATLAAAPWASSAPTQGERVVRAATRGEARSAPPAPREGPVTDKARDKEYKVKAALLFKFLQYATFPPAAFKDAKAPYEILVVGEDPFGGILEEVLGGKKVGNRPIKIRRVEEVPATLDAHLVFAGGLEPAERALLVQRTLDRPCLLIGEEDGFAAAGASINFYKKERKLAFEVNVTRQEDTGVTLKAELLKLARIVEKAPPRPEEKGDGKVPPAPEKREAPGGQEAVR